MCGGIGSLREDARRRGASGRSRCRCWLTVSACAGSGGAVLVQRAGLTEPRLMLTGSVRWRRATTNGPSPTPPVNGGIASTQWRRFSVSGAPPTAALLAVDLPEGSTDSLRRLRPAPALACWPVAQLCGPAQPGVAGRALPVLTLLRSRATAALGATAASAPTRSGSGKPHRRCPRPKNRPESFRRLAPSGSASRHWDSSAASTARLAWSARPSPACSALATWSPRAGATGEAKSAASQPRALPCHGSRVLTCCSTISAPRERTSSLRRCGIACSRPAELEPTGSRALLPWGR
jgi:hypothetical protein